MPLRYYPSFRTKNNLITRGGEFLLNDQSYVGPYYQTYDGKYFSGPNPVIGPSNPLTSYSTYQSAPSLSGLGVTSKVVQQLARVNKTQRSSPSSPVSYFPNPTEEDYSRGYVTRYFLKKVNDMGYVIEISPTEYANFSNGTVNYNVSSYLSATLLWKLTGPLNSIRVSQYDVRAGIIDTNKRLTENLNKTFIGITEFINEDYAKYVRVTQ